MEVNLRPDLQSKLEHLAAETGRPAGELVEEVVTGYFDDLALMHETLDSRYEDLKSGKIEPIDGEDAFARLKAKTEGARKRSA